MDGFGLNLDVNLLVFSYFLTATCANVVVFW